MKLWKVHTQITQDTENSDDSLRGGRLSGTDCQAVADMKFTCVVSCQQYGIDKRSGSPLAQDILRLMKRYPSLRIAYIDEVEESGNDRQKKNIKVYYSCLVKVSDPHRALPLDQASTLLFGKEMLLIMSTYKLGRREMQIASGNGEQALSRDVYRLGHHFDFFRMLSFYFSTVGYHFSALITVITVYAFLYGRLYLVLNGEGLSARKAIQDNKPLQVALASQSLVQIGFLMVLPMFMEISLERGYRAAVSEFILMQFQLAPMFFMFSLGTMSHYFGRTLLHGGAIPIYRSTGRGFVVFHVNFAENYRFYSRSHFVKGIELSIVLVVYEIFGHNYRSDVGYVLINISMWFMAGTWLFAPFLFNPSSFEWLKIVDGWNDWNIWIRNDGGIGIPPEKSWESWWEQEQQHLRYSGLWGIVVEILLSLRFFIYQYGLIYHLNITKRESNSFLIVSAWRRKLSAKSQSLIRIINGLIFLTFVPIVTLIALPHMSVQDIVIFVLAFVPTGWGMLQIAQALKPLVQVVGLWESVKTLARNYDMVMGLLLFTPVAFLSLFPFISDFQTRTLFNKWFSGDLQILSTLRGRRNARYSYNKRE
ncbi:hypothetical protein Ahy_A04g017258 isoform L [Arachis hypogaea]|uniref:Glycosyl transferase 48 domain-containing protein n=1 Tax=Arachis hypogaea TaxID=3818 RepID=A0A445DAK5_ARAHY|nr:hypothetical protein Ahy_A04g017258 isoform L [Arachis hypogaea]